MRISHIAFSFNQTNLSISNPSECIGSYARSFFQSILHIAIKTWSWTVCIIKCQCFCPRRRQRITNIQQVQVVQAQLQPQRTQAHTQEPSSTVHNETPAPESPIRININYLSPPHPIAWRTGTPVASPVRRQLFPESPFFGSPTHSEDTPDQIPPLRFFQNLYQSSSPIKSNLPKNEVFEVISYVNESQELNTSFDSQLSDASSLLNYLPEDQEIFGIIPTFEKDSILLSLSESAQSPFLECFNTRIHAIATERSGQPRDNLSQNMRTYSAHCESFVHLSQNRTLSELDESLRNVVLHLTELYLKILLSKFSQIKLEIYKARLETDEHIFQKFVALFCMINLVPDESLPQQDINRAILEAFNQNQSNELMTNFISKLEENNLNFQNEFNSENINPATRRNLSLILFSSMNDYFSNQT